MYLSNIALFNFRRFKVLEKDQPGLSVDLHPGLNIIVGENDSGKTAVVDAIRLLLGTVSDDFQRIEDDDFYQSRTGDVANSFKIVGLFKDLTPQEAGIFLEWLSFDDANNYELRLSLVVEKKQNSNGNIFIDRDLTAGDIGSETAVNTKARSFLKVTYLKALRNASDELTPGFRSHLPKMLMANSVFRDNPDSENKLVTTLNQANTEIENFFKTKDQNGVSINGALNGVLSNLHDKKEQEKAQTSFQLPQASLDAILRQLSLKPEDVNLGLGNMNLLFIACELALLKDHVKSVVFGPNITLIEELEAHLHVQAQIRLIKYIENTLRDSEVPHNC